MIKKEEKGDTRNDIISPLVILLRIKQYQNIFC